MTQLTFSGRIDLTDWEFGFGELDKILSKNLSEALDSTFREAGVYASLPYIYGRGDVDPLTVEVNLPLDTVDACLDNRVSEEAVFRLSLRELFTDAINNCRDETILKLRDGLLEIAAAMQKAVVPNEPLPDLVDVVVPTFFKEAIDFDKFSIWAANDDFITFLDVQIAEADDLIRKIRSNKVTLEAARHSYSAEPLNNTQPSASAP